MSRSYKKQKYFRHAGTSDKEDKRFANRRLRRAVRMKVMHGEDTFLDKRDLSDTWVYSSDGKSYWAEAAKQDMRK